MFKKMLAGKVLQNVDDKESNVEAKPEKSEDGDVDESKVAVVTPESPVTPDDELLQSPSTSEDTPTSPEGESRSASGSGGDDGVKISQSLQTINPNSSDKTSQDSNPPSNKKKGARGRKVQSKHDKIRMEFLIPKDKAAWLEYLVGLVRKKIKIEYLNDKELRKVIMRARPNLAIKKPEVKFDPDAPLCLNWTVEQMANWISAAGFPYLKEAFLMNHISGRRLILVDATALNQMGMHNLDEMKKVTSKIRDLLKIPAPNMLRAIMRIPPFERFIQRKVHTGSETDALTFEKFCTQEGFHYTSLKGIHKNAQIPCTCEVRILPVGVLDDDEEDIVESEGEDLSLMNAPTVEFVVRNLAARDATVSYIIELMIENVFLPNRSRIYGKIAETWKNVMVSEMGELSPEDRLAFATAVAKALMDEMEHTAEVLSDIDLLQRYVQEQISPDHLEWLQYCAIEFMENILPIATLLALGELQLETIFAQEPEFNEFVDSIIISAEKRIKTMSLPGLSVRDISSGKNLVKNVLSNLVDTAVDLGEGALLRQKQEKDIMGFL